MAFFATGDLFGWTEAQLLAALSSAQIAHASGAALIQNQTGDQASQRVIQQNSAQRIKLLKRGLYEIWIQDQTVNPLYAGFDTEYQNTVLAKFS